ncbi:hypothetical protein N7523_006824 [Penicillium sp. IBT 18751x]|nr:hypothetical protein N7523_006824 [Penicillium sp. IBT 18751x]
MKVNDVFTSAGYDMVVAVTQKSINDQLNHLANPDIGTIKTTLVIEMGADPNNEEQWLPVVHEDWTSVPRDTNGLPVNPSMNAVYHPTIEIDKSGTVVNLVLSFKSGELYTRSLRTGNMQKGVDMTKWVFGIAVDLDFAGIERDKGKAAPAEVIAQLNNFLDNQFSVSQLFVNFESTNLLRFDPSVTSVGNSGPQAMEMFTYFMSSYLGAIQANSNANPYILGYAVTQTPQTLNPADAQISDSMKPVGCTFTLYKDDDPNKSTVNFILNTKLSGGKNGPGMHSTPGNFDYNPIATTEQCDGKMIYSSFCLLESVILKNFYQTYADQTHSLVKDHLTLSSNNDYDTAKIIKKDANGNQTGLSYKVYYTSGTDDDFQNSFDVHWSPTSTGVLIDLLGSIHIKKTNNTDVGAGNTATSWVSMDQNWSSTITLDCTIDSATNKPTIKASTPVITITSSNNDQYQNGWAKFLGGLGIVLGGLLDAITAGKFNLENTFSDNWGAHVDGIPQVNVTMDHLFDATHNSFMLPAGDIFYFKNIALSSEGMTEMELTYKTSTSGAATPNLHVISNHVSKVLEFKSQGQKTERKPTLPVRLQGQIDRPKVAPIKSQNPIPQPIKAASPAAPNTSKPLGAPVIDKFSLKGTEKDFSQENVDISVSCELMSNSQAGLPVSVTQDMVVVQDNTGQPLLFGIGIDKRFNLLTSVSGGSASGWATQNLLDSFPEYATATAFDVVQDTSGRISIAFCLQKNKDPGIDVFFASLLSNDLSRTDFGKLSALSTKVSGLDNVFVPNAIGLGSSDDGNRPVLTVEGLTNSKHIYYQLQAGDTTAQRLEFPEQLDPTPDSLLAHRMGHNFGQRANYFLYVIGQSKHISVITTADANEGSLAYDYSPGNNELPSAFRSLDYNTIETATSRPDPVDPASDLYIGARTGVYRIPNGKAASMELVSGDISDVHEIQAILDGDDISLWVTASPNKLYYIYGHRSPGNTSVAWRTPILFASNVLQVAAMRSAVKKANELFVLTQDQSITHYWQDPASTIWRSKVAVIKNDPYVLNLDSYTSHVHLEAKGLPLNGQIVKVTSSEWQYCVINGLMYSLDEDVAAEIPTDPMGNITIISTAVDISPPVLHIQSDAFLETINIYPNGKIHAHLQSITSGDSLKKALTQDGKPVLSQDTSAETANGVAANVMTLHSAAVQSFPPTLAGNTFVSIEKPIQPSPIANKASASKLKHTLNAPLTANHLPDNFATGLQFKRGTWNLHTLHTAQAVVKQAKMAKFSLGDLTDIAGDVWHHLEELGGEIISAVENAPIVLSEGINFIISKAQGVLQFILTIGDKVVSIALKSFLLVFKALNYILKLVGIDISKLLAWLGHLLGWDHIWNTHKMIASTLTNFLDFAEANSAKYIDMARVASKSVADTLEKSLKAIILPDNLKTQTPAATASQANSKDESTAWNSPQSNFAAYHFMHSASGGASPAKNAALPTVKAVSSPGNPVTQIFDDVLKPIADVLISKIGTDAGDVLALVRNHTMDDLRQLAFDVSDTIISVFATLVDGLLKLIEDVIGEFKGLLETEWNLPIISDLYELVSELLGDGEKFSIVNGISFLVAIPIVVVTEIAGIGSLEQHNTFGMDHPGFPQTLASQMDPTQRPVIKATSLSTKGLTTMNLDAAADPPSSDLVTYSGIAGLIAAGLGVFGSIGDIFDTKYEIELDRTWKVGLIIGQAVFGFPIQDESEKEGQDNYQPWIWRVLTWLASSIYDVIEEWEEKFTFGADGDTNRAIGRAVLDFFCIVITLGVDTLENIYSSAPETLSSDLACNLGGLAYALGEANKSEELSVVGSGMAILGSTEKYVLCPWKDLFEMTGLVTVFNTTPPYILLQSDNFPVVFDISPVQIPTEWKMKEPSVGPLRMAMSSAAAVQADGRIMAENQVEEQNASKDRHIARQWTEDRCLVSSDDFEPKSAALDDETLTKLQILCKPGMEGYHNIGGVGTADAEIEQAESSAWAARPTINHYRESVDV